MKFGLIYKITNPIGQSYIGQSIEWEIRYRNYKNLRCKKQKLLYYSLKHYGVENHKFEIIANNISQGNDLDIAEICAIYVHDSFGKNGLNCTIGGDKPPSRKGMSCPSKGKKNPKIAGKNHPMYGKKHSEETRQKISQKGIGRHCSEETRAKLIIINGGKGPIICIETGEIFQSQCEAARRLNIRQSNISLVLNGKRKHVSGFTLKYIA